MGSQQPALANREVIKSPCYSLGQVYETNDLRACEYTARIIVGVETVRLQASECASEVVDFSYGTLLPVCKQTISCLTMVQSAEGLYPKVENGPAW